MPPYGVLIFLVLAFVLFLIAAFTPQAEPARPRYMALGLAAWILAQIIARQAG